MTEIPDENPRKRPRLDDILAEPRSDRTSPKPLARDPDYYKDSGDCVIQVENVLFKIHKERLAHDTSAFEGMFGFPPSHDDATQCSSDKNPLICHDTEPQFRALCWALYAVPTEILAQMKKGASMRRLVDLAFITNKYSFSSYETWALDALSANISCPEDVVNHRSPDMFIPIVDIAAICGHKKLLRTIMPGWIQMAKMGRVPLDSILDTCERHNLRNWQCEIYMFCAKRMIRRNVQNLDSTNVVAPLSYDNLGLKGIHLHRVLSGYASLSITSARVRTGVPTLERSSGCESRWHQTKCTVMWKYFWEETTKNQTSLNVVGDLEVAILDTFHSTWNAKDGIGAVNPECHILGARTVQKLRDDIKKSIPQYFFGADSYFP